jgi:hypothetical protein
VRSWLILRLSLGRANKTTVRIVHLWVYIYINVCANTCVHNVFILPADFELLYLTCTVSFHSYTFKMSSCVLNFLYRVQFIYCEGKVKLSLCLTKHYSMKNWRERRYSSKHY